MFASVCIILVTAGKITKAMKMVAASKMRNAQASMDQSRGIVDPFIRLFGDWPGELRLRVCYQPSKRRISPDWRQHCGTGLESMLPSKVLSCSFSLPQSHG